MISIDSGNVGVVRENKSGLTPDEEKVSNHLIEAWNKYVMLERMHPDDMNEFRLSIHRLQHLLAIRAVRRDYPDEWYSVSKEDKRIRKIKV